MHLAAKPVANLFKESKMERKVPNMKESSPDHKMMHDHVKQHAAGHKHHSEMFKPHAAGHQYEQEKVEAMCKGGKA